MGHPLRATLTATSELPPPRQPNSATYTSARQSLYLCVVLSAAPGCLITDVPEKGEDVSSPPQLINPEPPPGVHLLIPVPNNLATDQALSAEVLSEDAGADLRAVLLIDYGVEDPSGNPYRDGFPQTPIKASTIAAGPRKVSTIWRVEPNSLVDPSPGEITSVGCHTVTLLVTHAFRENTVGYWCPRSNADYASITWFAAVCADPTSPFCTFDDCPVSDQGPFHFCADLEGSQ